MRLDAITTPALCVDAAALERNIGRMVDHLAGRPCRLRPHFKAHKTPAIARLQAAAGVVGFTCATLAEAEALADHGFTDVLIANEILDRQLVPRLRSLAQRIDLTLAVDSVESVAIVADVPAGVLVDVNVGLPRCGALPDEVVTVAEAIRGTRLGFRGVMGYEGHAMAIADPAERAAVATTAMEVLAASVGTLRAAGFDVEIVSAGGTGTFDVTGAYPGVTELQAGSYALMDTAYARYGLPFEEALGCRTTVLAVHGRLAALDAGLKALAVDHGNPSLPDAVDADVLFLSDEHTSLRIGDTWTLRPGERTWLRPSHVDPTVNLYAEVVARRGDDVIDVWPVVARGYAQASPRLAPS